MTKTIGVAKLRKLGACHSQVDKFKEIFGNKPVAVTVELCVAHAQDFNWDWAANNLLTAPAKTEYSRVVASARSEYNRVVAPARSEYDRVAAAARSEYNRVVAPALAEYDRVVAAAWATAYLNQ